MIESANVLAVSFKEKLNYTHRLLKKHFIVKSRLSPASTSTNCYLSTSRPSINKQELGIRMRINMFFLAIYLEQKKSMEYYAFSTHFVK